jgi:hypothetical protein
MTLDLGDMVAVATSAAIVAALVSMGAVKIAPNFARWGINKVAGMFR